MRFGFLAWVILLAILLVVGSVPATTGPSGPDATTWLGSRAQVREMHLEERIVREELFALSLEAERATARLAVLREQLQALRGELEVLAGELAAAQERYLEARDRARSALRLLQRSGPLSHLEVLLGATTLRDLLRRLDLVTFAGRRTTAVLTELDRVRATLTARHASLEEGRRGLEALVVEQERLLAVLDERPEQRERLLVKLGERRAAHEEMLAVLEAT